MSENVKKELKEYQINVRLPEWMYRKLKEISAKESEDLSVVVRRVMRYGIRVYTRVLEKEMEAINAELV